MSISNNCLCLCLCVRLISFCLSLSLCMCVFTYTPTCFTLMPFYMIIYSVSFFGLFIRPFVCFRAAWLNWLLNSWILTQGHPSGWTALKSKHEHTNKGSNVCNVIELYSSIQCVWLAICRSIHILFGRLVPKRYKGKQTLITDQFPEEGRKNKNVMVWSGRTGHRQRSQ